MMELLSFLNLKPKKLMRSMRYLKRTIDVGIRYGSDVDFGGRSSVYVDFNLAGGIELGFSMAGGVFYLEGGSIDWTSKLQTAVAT